LYVRFEEYAKSGSRVDRLRAHENIQSQNNHTKHTLPSAKQNSERTSTVKVLVTALIRTDIVIIVLLSRHTAQDLFFGGAATSSKYKPLVNGKHPKVWFTRTMQVQTACACVYRFIGLVARSRLCTSGTILFIG